MNATKKQFTDAYRETLVQMYAWATHSDALNKFMESCEATLAGANTWNFHGHAVNQAWVAIGGKGKPTLKALRALQ